MAWGWIFAVGRKWPGATSMVWLSVIVCEGSVTKRRCHTFESCRFGGVFLVSLIGFFQYLIYFLSFQDAADAVKGCLERKRISAILRQQICAKWQLCCFAVWGWPFGCVKFSRWRWFGGGYSLVWYHAWFAHSLVYYMATGWFNLDLIGKRWIRKISRRWTRRSVFCSALTGTSRARSV